MKNQKKLDAIALLNLLEAARHEARLVGGCVRDELLGVEPKDYDIASTASPDQVVALFKKNRMRFLDYGKEHGTITALMPSGPVEITTLREDVKTHGRRAEVEFHNDFEADARRRDFTINAMSEDKDGKIYDYFEGQKHLRAKRLQFVGDPKTRIREDYLRILRFFRFKSRFHLKSDDKTLKAIASEKKGLEKVSQERITTEILGIFQSQVLKKTLEEMSSTGILGFIFAGYSKLTEKERKQIARCLEALAHVNPELRSQTRIAIFVWFIGLKKRSKDPSFRWKQFAEMEEAYLRLSNKEKFFILHLVQAADELANVKTQRSDHLLYVDKYDAKEESWFLEYVLPFLNEVFKGSTAKVKKIAQIVRAEKMYGYRRKPIALQGKELMIELGIPTGPLVGEVIHLLRCAYMNGEWDTKEEAFTWLRKNILI